VAEKGERGGAYDFELLHQISKAKVGEGSAANVVVLFEASQGGWSLRAMRKSRIGHDAFRVGSRGQGFVLRSTCREHSAFRLCAVFLTASREQGDGLGQLLFKSAYDVVAGNERDVAVE